MIAWDEDSWLLLSNEPFDRHRSRFRSAMEQLFTMQQKGDISLAISSEPVEARDFDRILADSTLRSLDITRGTSQAEDTLEHRIIDAIVTYLVGDEGEVLVQDFGEKTPRQQIVVHTYEGQRTIRHSAPSCS